MNAEDYVHRIGRTGRAGEKGRAITLVSPSDKKFLANVEKLIKKSIDVMDVDGAKKESHKDSDKADKKKNDKKSDSKDQSQNKKSQGSKSKDKKTSSSSKKSHKASNDIRGFGDEVPAFFKAWFYWLIKADRRQFSG